MDRWYSFLAYVREKGYLVLISEEITESKRAEEIIRVSEQRYRTLFEAVPIGVVITDLKGAITEINQVACENIGLTESQLKARNPAPQDFKFLHEDMSPFTEDEYPRKIASNGKSIKNQVTGLYNQAQSKYRWIVTNAIPIRNSKDESTSILYTFTDITALKEAEKKILNRKNLIKNVTGRWRRRKDSDL